MSCLDVVVLHEGVQPAGSELVLPHEVVAEDELHLQQQARPLAQGDDLDVLLDLLGGVAHEGDEG
eukprot:scaffold648358_cov34-Prasinocladus_malaysianus.AAC.1